MLSSQTVLQSYPQKVNIERGGGYLLEHFYVTLTKFKCKRICADNFTLLLVAVGSSPGNLASQLLLPSHL